MNSPKTLLAAASAALILRPAWSWAQTATEPNKYDWDHMSPMMWGGGWFGMIFGPLFMLLALAVVIAVVVILVRWLGGPWYGAQPPYQPPPGRRRSTFSKSVSHAGKSTRKNSKSVAACRTVIVSSSRR